MVYDLMDVYILHTALSVIPPVRRWLDLVDLFYPAVVSLQGMVVAIVQVGGHGEVV